MKDHIHTWNDYKEGKLCCSTCGITYNKYLFNSCNTEQENKR